MSNPSAFVDSINEWANSTLSQHVKTWNGSVDPDQKLRLQAAELNFFGAMVPKSSGGQEFDFKTLLEALENIAAVDFGFALSLVNSHNVALRLSLSASDRVRRTVVPKILSGKSAACTALTEPTAGSDFSAIRTRAYEAKKGWIINGQKTWIVNASFAQFAIVFAQCGEPSDGSKIGAFLVDLNDKNIERYPQEAYFAQRSIGTGGFHLNDVWVDADQLILSPGDGFKQILKEINAARTYVAAMSNAMLSKALCELREYSGERYLFSKRLCELKVWKNDVSSAQKALKASHDFTRTALEVVNSNGNARFEAAKAKVFAVDMLQEHLPKLLQLMGAAGLSLDFCFSRHLAAAQIAGFTDGSSNLLRQSLNS